VDHLDPVGDRAIGIQIARDRMRDAHHAIRARGRRPDRACGRPSREEVDVLEDPRWRRVNSAHGGGGRYAGPHAPRDHGARAHVLVQLP
jgi:hypothetical protein